MDDVFLVLILLGGIFLIALEIMVIPGFTYFGVSGIVLLLVAIIYAFLHYSATIALTILFLSIIISIAFFIWFFKKGINRSFSLKDREDVSDGYLPYQEDYQKYDQKTGTAHSPLRPAGIVIIEGAKLNAISQGDYIDAGDVIKVLKVEGSKLIVRKIS